MFKVNNKDTGTTPSHFFKGKKEKKKKTNYLYAGWIVFNNINDKFRRSTKLPVLFIQWFGSQCIQWKKNLPPQMLVNKKIVIK